MIPEAILANEFASSLAVFACLPQGNVRQHRSACGGSLDEMSPGQVFHDCSSSWSLGDGQANNGQRLARISRQS